MPTSSEGQTLLSRRQYLSSLSRGNTPSTPRPFDSTLESCMLRPVASSLDPSFHRVSCISIQLQVFTGSPASPFNSHTAPSAPETKWFLLLCQTHCKHLNGQGSPMTAHCYLSYIGCSSEAHQDTFLSLASIWASSTGRSLSSSLVLTLEAGGYGTVTTTNRKGVGGEEVGLLFQTQF